MKSDETLLNASEVPTVDDLKAFFRKTDFTAGIAVNDVQRTEEGLYKEVRRCFSSSWDKSLKHLGVKESGPNYSSSSPLAVLKRADSDIIASSVLDIMRSEELTDEYFDSFFRIVEKPLSEKLEAYAAGVGKAVDDLTDEETTPLVDEMADALLSKMTELLQRTQSVPEIAQVQKQRPQEEDFSDQFGNYGRIDFLRQWNHSRTKIGQMLSIDQIENDEEAITNGETAFLEDEEFIKLTDSFLKTLSETDRKIFLLTAKGKSQDEIAAELGYKNNSAVSKRLKRIREQYRSFLSKNNYQT